MKLKFKATAQDWLIFGIFAVVLLYVVCIAVLNIHSFSTTGIFAGLNPFPAFLPEFLPATIIFYFFSIIVFCIQIESNLYVNFS